MKTIFRFAFVVACVVPGPGAGIARAQFQVVVDPTADVHPISPLIYGMNFVDAGRAAAANIPLTRWGGNSTTRYNYLIDVTNTGADYYFENIAGCWNAQANWCGNPPANPTDASGANAFLKSAAQLQMTTLFTVPTIGWVAKAPPQFNHPFSCGCPKTAIPQQDGFDPYDMNCGNGKINNSWVACPPATTTSTLVDPTFVNTWVGYLTNRFGPANGTRIYALDNEPNLWSSTHHDVHPTQLTYNELWQRMRDYSLAIVQADPTAQVAGPAEWGWPNYFCSDADNINKGCFANSPDRAQHGGEELMAWLLDQAAAYEKANGKRLLHYLDLHYYPQGGNPPAITKSLWDPSYTDPSWINAKIRLIPRMRDWVNQHYPGTKLAISEYDFYHHNEAAGALAYAEVLGIFGREGLDAATAWNPPNVNEAAFAAYRLYRNYDGNGGRFESTSVRATVVVPAPGPGDGLEAYAAVGPTRMTVVLVNESNVATTGTVAIGGFAAGPTAKWFASSGPMIVKQPDVPVQNGKATVTLAATSIGMLVVDGQWGIGMADGGVPDLAAGDAAMMATRDAATAAQDAAMMAAGDAATAARDAATGGAQDAASGAAALATSGPGDAAQAPVIPAAGCGCRVAARSTGGSTAWLVGLALLAMAARRQRDRASREWSMGAGSPRALR